MKLYFFFLCVNLFFFIIASFDTSLGFQTATFPLIYNNTQPTNSTFLVGNLTKGAGNSTATGQFTFLDWFADSSQRILFFLQVPLDFIGLGFIFSTFSAVSSSMGIVWPTGLVFGLEVILGFLFFVWLKYNITGRSDAGFT